MAFTAAEKRERRAAFTQEQRDAEAARMRKRYHDNLQEERATRKEASVWSSA